MRRLNQICLALVVLFACEKSLVDQADQNMTRDKVATENSMVDPDTPEDAAPLINNTYDGPVLKSPPGSNWQLIFSDEFSSSSLNTSKWNYNYPWGHNHNHQAWCVPENISFTSGKLKITARDERHPDAPQTATSGGKTYVMDYQSGAIHSKNKFGFTYGYIEGRFKSSHTQGTWPAFWTLNTSGEWPPEIDILEIPISDANARKTQHYYYHYGNGWQNHKSFGSKKNHGVNLSSAYHVYGCEWGPNYMKFYFDGNLLGTWTGRPECKQGKNMYILINLAVGGWPGTPPAGASFPDSYYCDWVRVYQKPHATGKKFITHKSSNKKLKSAGSSTGSNIVLNTSTGTDAQWELEGVNGTYYYIVNKSSGKKLYASSSGDVSLGDYTWNGNYTQWKPISIDGTWFYLQHRGTGQKLHARSSEGWAVNLVPSSWTGNNVRWKFVNP